VAKVVKLLLCFNLTFVIILTLTAGVGFLQVWIDSASSVPARSLIRLAEFIPAVEWALPFTLYVTTLLSMSYALRTRVPALMAFVVLFVCAFVFTYAVSLGISHTKRMDAPPMDIGRETLGKQGLVLTGRGVTAVLLDDPAKALGERVVSLGDRPLLYQAGQAERGENPAPLPAVQFKTRSVALFDSLAVDFSLAAKEFSARFADGPVSYAAYTGAVIFTLLSMVAILDIGAWPLANIFIGVVLFRLILAFEVFICGRETLAYITGFLGRWIPPYLVAPLIIGVVGVLLALYSGLVYVARNGDRRHG
jgi:hypothetical protein